MSVIRQFGPLRYSNSSLGTPATVEHHPENDERPLTTAGAAKEGRGEYTGYNREQDACGGGKRDQASRSRVKSDNDSHEGCGRGPETFEEPNSDLAPPRLGLPALSCKPIVIGGHASHRDPMDQDHRAGEQHGGRADACQCR